MLSFVCVNFRLKNCYGDGEIVNVCTICRPYTSFWTNKFISVQIKTDTNLFRKITMYLLNRLVLHRRLRRLATLIIISQRNLLLNRFSLALQVFSCWPFSKIVSACATFSFGCLQLCLLFESFSTYGFDKSFTPNNEHVGTLKWIVSVNQFYFIPIISLSCNLCACMCVAHMWIYQKTT